VTDAPQSEPTHSPDAQQLVEANFKKPKFSKRKAKLSTLTLREANKILDRSGDSEASLAKLKEQAQSRLIGSEDYKKYLDAVQRVRTLWRSVVELVGETEAKNILRQVTGAKKTGRREDYPLFILIYGYLRRWGLEESDEKIAKRILDNRPRYVYVRSGDIIEVYVAHDWMPESRLGYPDDQIVASKPLTNEAL
jgi:hypothetical protein